VLLVTILLNDECGIKTKDSFLGSSFRIPHSSFLLPFAVICLATLFSASVEFVSRTAAAAVAAPP
jgi:hypothetical protein